MHACGHDFHMAGFSNLTNVDNDPQFTQLLTETAEELYIPSDVQKLRGKTRRCYDEY